MKLPELRRVRELRGLTQPELAAASGVSMRTIVNEEHGGEARPSTARKLAVALDVSLTVLAGVETLGVAQQKVPQEAPEPPPLNLPAMQQERDANLRRGALEASTPAQLARYLRDVERMMVATGMQLRGPELQEPGGQGGLAQYLQELLDLREEAEPYVASMLP
jgi:transcriptional regulator with XRE-family HTH domain